MSKALEDDLEHQPSRKSSQIPAVSPSKPRQFDQKTRLFGMIQTEKKVDLPRASKFVGMSIDEIRGLIYDLVGEGKVQGEFIGDTFLIKSDIGDFIASLDKEFAAWGTERKAD